MHMGPLTLLIFVSIGWTLVLGFFFLPELVRRRPIFIAAQVWPFKKIIRVLAISILANFLSIPQFTYLIAVDAGSIFSWIIMGLIIARVAVAYFMREKGNGWFFYFLISWYSPIWIPIVVNYRFDLLR